MFPRRPLRGFYVSRKYLKGDSMFLRGILCFIESLLGDSTFHRRPQNRFNFIEGLQGILYFIEDLLGYSMFHTWISCFI